MTTGRPAVSVVVPTYERRASVERLLAALSDQTLAPSAYEVIIVVDGSTDGTYERVTAWSAPYRLRAIWTPNGGRASARNTGIRAATGDVIVMLDDDMEPARGCLDAHRLAHEAAPRRGVLGAVPVVVSGGTSPIVEYVSAKFTRQLARLAKGPIGFEDFYSGNFSIRRDVVLAVGGFDEAFKLYGNEDAELALRLLKAGVVIVYSETALAYQHYEKDFAAVARDHVAKAKTAVLYVRKYPEVLGELKLSTYRQGWRRWRVLRAVLLAMSARLTWMPDAVILFVRWLERRRPARLDDYYAMALDYFYWLGAREALADGGRPAPLRDRP